MPANKALERIAELRENCIMKIEEQNQGACGAANLSDYGYMPAEQAPWSTYAAFAQLEQLK